MNVDQLLTSADVRGALIALAGVVVAGLVNAIVGEWRAGRDDRRRRDRDRRDRKRVARQQGIDATRAYLSAEYEAMRRHVSDGLNVVRPRRADYPRLILSVVGDRDALDSYRRLVVAVFTSPAGDRSADLLAEIDRVHEVTGLNLSTQELRLADDAELANAGLTGWEETHDPFSDR